MNRFIRKETSLLRASNDDEDDDDEEQLYERQALIDDQELCGDNDNDQSIFMSTSPNGIRCRQSAGKIKWISGFNNNEGLELKNINKTRDFISEPIVEYTLYDIEPNDTLQSICLRYACSVNQVKRINGLMNDQEFYGLRRIKLPLGRLGLLEDILKQQREQSAGNGEKYRQRMVNSPGSALFVSTNQQNSGRFKPLLSPGYSSDRINELNKISRHNQNDGHICLETSSNQHNRLQQNHSHSLSSLNDFTSNNTIDICIDNQQLYPDNHGVDIKKLKQQSFIKSELEQKHGELLDIVEDSDNVRKVFQDLDYHVERAKAAAENYDQRAAELVDKIDIIGAPQALTNLRQSRVSKIPELFFASENFGLNYKKLIILIIIVCLVVPLVGYISKNQAVQHVHVVPTKLK